MSVKGVAIEVEPSCEMWSILLVSGGVTGVVVPSEIFETLAPLMCKAPNEPVEVDEPLIFAFAVGNVTLPSLAKVRASVEALTKN